MTADKVLIRTSDDMDLTFRQHADNRIFHRNQTWLSSDINLNFPAPTHWVKPNVSLSSFNNYLQITR